MAQLSLVLAARDYPRLRTLFYGVVEHWLGDLGVHGESVLAVSLAASALGICNSVRHVRNAKRFPVTPTMVGFGLQVCTVVFSLPEYYLTTT